MNEYEMFLEQKSHTQGKFGFMPEFLPSMLFDFQKFIVEHAVQKGRCGLFMDTGTGKTIVELVIAKNHVGKTNKRVLIITPLAVAFQFIREAEKFNIDDISYSKRGELNTKIIVCNYERLSYFEPDDFDCVLLDESSILKNFDGAIKQQITTFLKKVKYRYLFTATPAPNDFIELGTSSEALGYMGYTDMLTRFFTNNEKTIGPMAIGTEWVLKGHAKENFFKWVRSWSLSMRKPSDLGFSDANHILPELITNYHSINNSNDFIDEKGAILLMRKDAKSMSEIKQEQKQTITERCEKAVELASNHETSVYWCNLNPEGDLLQKLDPTACQLKGAMDVDKKEEILLAFSNGEIKRLITKPKITCFGLNWQHCGHTVFFPTWSYEQWYQAIRRFWRFGRKGEVVADIVHSNGQARVLRAILTKGDKAVELFSRLNAETNKSYNIKCMGFDKPVSLPKFLL